MPWLFLRCSSVRLVGPSWKPDQFGSLGSQCKCLIPHIVLGCPLIHGSPGQLISIPWERSGTASGSAVTSPKQEKWSPSGMELYCTSSTSLLWWNTHAPSVARSHITELQVLKSNRLHISNSAPWYIGNAQIHDNMGVPSFTDRIRSLRDLTQS